jgi:tetratricopeptide (TPR) repeat protein
MDDARDWCTSGIVHLHNGMIERAIYAFTNGIEAGPKNVEMYRNRGISYVYKGEPDKAIADFMRAIQLASEDRAPLDTLLDLAILQEGSRPDDAESLYQQIVTSAEKNNLRDPDVALTAMSALCCMHARKGRCGEAKRLYSTFLDICSKTSDKDSWPYTDLPSAYHGMADYTHEEEAWLILFQDRLTEEATIAAANGLAWIYGMCPRSDMRNGKLGIKYATQACELTKWGDPQYIGALAAAYAQTGDFQSAVKFQEKAIDVLKNEFPKTGELLADYEACLKLYREGKPYRMEPRDTPAGQP